jgi:hypothetical protein
MKQMKQMNADENEKGTATDVRWKENRILLRLCVRKMANHKKLSRQGAKALRRKEENGHPAKVPQSKYDFDPRIKNLCAFAPLREPFSPLHGQTAIIFCHTLCPELPCRFARSGLC